MRIFDVVLQPGAYDTDKRSDATGLECKDPSLTVQSDATDADINTIVQRFGLTGTVPSGLRIPQYGDFSEVVDYRSALEAVREAEARFMELPAATRARFENDPQLFLEFCDQLTPDGTALANLDEMRKMGLAIPAKETSDESANKDAGGA